MIQINALLTCDAIGCTDSVSVTLVLSNKIYYNSDGTCTSYPEQVLAPSSIPKGWYGFKLGHVSTTNCMKAAIAGTSVVAQQINNIANVDAV